MSVPMSYYHKPRTNPPDNRTLVQILDDNTTKHPDKESIVFYNEDSDRSCLTFQQLKDQSISFAASLLKLGFKRGDRVLLYAPNSLEFVVCWMALNRLGVCAVLKNVNDVEWESFELLKRLKCNGLICGLNVTDNQRQRLVSEIMEIAEQKNPDGKCYVKVIITIRQGDTRIAHAQVCKYEDLMDQVDDDNKSKVMAAQSRINSEDPVFVYFTSGSTSGVLKATTFSNHSVVSAFTLAIPGINVNGLSKRFLGRYIAWNYGAVSLVSALINGNTCVTCVYSKITIKDSFKYMLDIIQKERCSSGCGIPPQHVHQLLRQNFHENYDFSQVKSWSFGSQIVHRKTIESLLNVFPDKKSVLAYAASEVLTVAFQLLNRETITKKEDYGKMYILPDIEVKVIDDDEGHVVPLGSKGEICVRGVKVFLEYLEDPEGTAKAKEPSGWVHTSDYGIMFDRARIKVLGRKSDLIDSQNKAVFPVEVEEILIEHPDVLDVVAVGIPGNDMKEDICACVIESPGSNLEKKVDELHKWCAQQFSVANGNSNLKPKHIVFLEALPISRACKIDRRFIKQLMAREILGS